jgi:hypothetical protein
MLKALASTCLSKSEFGPHFRLSISNHVLANHTNHVYSSKHKRILHLKELQEYYLSINIYLSIILARKLLGVYQSLQLFFIKSALLKLLKSLKPIPSSFFLLPMQLQLIQCTLDSLLDFFHHKCCISELISEQRAFGRKNILIQ